ncbi:MAG: deoxyribose-phosphate aldolase [Oscillospiraceae bacterium]|nr:deoxyribose-phosphate aldolase [Oscillospiraceae bacterium]
MDNSYILRHVDHTLLAATASFADIDKLCAEAARFNTASVCVPPCYVEYIKAKFEVTVCTVIGFPLGYDVTAAKLAAARAALDGGADEIDMVVNLTDVKNGAFDRVSAEIAALKNAAGSRILKVIVETCCLEEPEKIAMCKAVTGGGADYIKTSTGFGAGGAVLSDVELFKAHIGPDVKIKASGGIRTREAMTALLEAGCSRIGTSSAIKLLCAT